MLALTSRPFRRPQQLIDEHSSRLHLLIPGMIDDVFGFVIRAERDRIVTGPENVTRNSAQDARTGFVSGIGIRSHNLIGQPIVHAIGFILPPTAAVETIVAALMFSHTRSFHRM